jgi:AcrR family transcriptional regulator
MRERIKQAAVDQFDSDGYYGTTVRNIAKAVDCSLPMVYYYFQSKRELFHEIIKKDYFELLKRQAAKLQPGDLIAFYTEYVFGLHDLNDYDRKVYRLGVKVYLSFDGDEELKQVMDEWERSILPRHCQLILPRLKDADNGLILVRTLMHLLENLVESIVVKNRVLSREEIREELSVILSGRY